ncbi:hypothetical protein CYLTODRAFT_454103 [Cylindrobasidium torrendii FP15055 ss-10]|uniref:Uncharacterized protein n=1 Tax=Cylindrobasidium torrendii FP15055 ss-10 TaxID=1314674 RepID=A0A0D7BC49_9AGAR|nr:hypothetical protein CYLTODRAFT_454103 [Cylindrobasidium torrendii FP15055 ss-10]
MKTYQVDDNAELMRHSSAKIASRHSANGHFAAAPYDSTKFSHHEILSESCTDSASTPSLSDVSEDKCANVGYTKRTQIPPPPWASTSSENHLSKDDENALMEELEALGPSADDTSSSSSRCEVGVEETPYVPDPHTAWCEKYARASGWIPAEPYDIPPSSHPPPSFSGTSTSSPSNTAPDWTPYVYPWYLVNYDQSESYCYDASQLQLARSTPLG